MKTVFLSISAILFLVFSSCRPEPIPIKLPDGEPQIVVASQVVPNSTMIIALSRSFSALIPTDTGANADLLNQILVAHGRVTVAYNGKVDTLLRIAPGFYGTFQTPLKSNVHYTLVVYDSTTGKSVTAETQMQPRVPIDSVWVSVKVAERDTQRTMNLRFKDPAGENYYMLNIYRNTDFVKNVITDPAAIFKTGRNDLTTYPLSDKLFASPDHLEQIDISGWFGKGDTLRVTLSNISSDYYTYLVQKQRAARNGLGAFFGEPVNYSTNVKNGLGFFTAYWPDSRSWILKE